MADGAPVLHYRPALGGHTAQAGCAGVVWRGQNVRLSKLPPSRPLMSSAQKDGQQTVAEMPEFRASTGLNVTKFAA